MSEYTDTLQSLENDYEAQLLNEFYNQEKIHWKPVSNQEKKLQLQKIRDNYYSVKKAINQKLKDKVND